MSGARRRGSSRRWASSSIWIHAVRVPPPSTVPAREIFTKAENGLARDWRGVVWLNPPFSSKRAWYQRLIDLGNPGIALMPARTETHDLQTYMAAAQAILFLKGRIYFERGARPQGNGTAGITTTPPFGIVLCAYGPRLAEKLLASRVQGLGAAPIHREIAACSARSNR